MEPKPITIEIKRDTAVMLTAMAVGLLLVGGTYFYTYDPADHWSTVNVTGVVAGLFMLGLAAYMMRPPVAAKQRWWTLSLVTAILATLSVGWVRMEDQSRWQRKLLLDIRTNIGQNILLADVSDTLRHVLAAHYEQVSPRPNGIGTTFRKLYPGAHVGTDLRVHHYDGDSAVALVQEISDTLVTLVGIDPVARGKDPSFQMYNGRIGRLQMRFRLNYRGMTYEREN